MDETKLLVIDLRRHETVHDAAEQLDAVARQLCGAGQMLRESSPPGGEPVSLAAKSVDEAIADLHRVQGTLHSLQHAEVEPFVSEWQICGESVLPSDAYV